MRLTAKVIYACRAITELALWHDKKVPIQLQAISKAQHIPEQFLVQLLIRLKNANIVSSSRGILGGYNLLRSPTQLSVADVVRAVDDSLISENNIPVSKGKNRTDKIFNCLWSDINHTVTETLEKLTFDTIVAQIKDEQLTYYI